jgi:transposase-like protein
MVLQALFRQSHQRELARGECFTKWRWTVIAVTLDLVFVAFIRKEWPMTFIAVRWPHCQRDQIVKHGKTRRGSQRYFCQHTLCAKSSGLLNYSHRGGLA